MSPSSAGWAVPVNTTAPVKSATNADAGDAASSAAVPSWITRPPSITPTRSPSRAASVKSWVTSRAGTPVSARTAASSRPPAARERGSSADSGSSSSNAAGRRASARATATRWRSPPDSVRGRSSARCATPKRSSSSDRAPAALAAVEPAQRVGDVLPHPEVGEQRVLLEHVAAAAMLGRHVDAALGLEPHLIPARDAPAVGSDEAGHDRAASRSCRRPTGRPAPGTCRLGPRARRRA